MPESPNDIVIDETKRNRPINLLFEAMEFWHGEGQRIIKEIDKRLRASSHGKDAAVLAMKWKDIDDRWIDIANKLAPYTAPKLASMEINQKVTKRYVIEVPSIAQSPKDWEQRVIAEQQLLPKYSPITQVDNSTDDTIDEAEYEDINEAYR